MRKMSAERPSNPQQNHRGVESNAPLAMDGGSVPGPACAMPPADCPGRKIMRAVSFFGPGSPPAGFGCGCGRKTGEGVTCVRNSGGRSGIGRDSCLGLALRDDGGGDRRGGLTGVVSGFWGSAL